MTAFFTHWPVNAEETEQRSKSQNDENRLSNLFGVELSSVPADTCIVGRSPDCDVVVDHRLVSREHLKISKSADWALTDLNSTNGTILNGSLVMVEEKLSNGDEIELPGARKLVFQETGDNERIFYEMYSKYYSRDFPIELSEHQLLQFSHELSALGNRFDGIIFANPAAVESKDFYFAQSGAGRFLSDAPEGYFMTGWWGHGINSTAFYFMEKSETLGVFFRMSSGTGDNVYENTESAAKELSEFMERFQSFRQRLASYPCKVALNAPWSNNLEYSITMDLTSITIDAEGYQRLSSLELRGSVDCWTPEGFPQLEKTIEEFCFSALHNEWDSREIFVQNPEQATHGKSRLTHAGGFNAKLACTTDKGLERSHNEDAFGLVFPDEFISLSDLPSSYATTLDACPCPIEGFAVIADGMGGMAAGEIASHITVNSVVHEIMGICRAWMPNGLDLQRRDHFSFAYQKDPQAALESVLESAKNGDAHQYVLKTALESVLDYANLAVLEEAARNPKRGRMGTTCTAAAVSHGKLYILHVGDSRAYLFRDGVLSALTHDHSWVQDQVDKGKITPEQAWNHPRKNIITRAVGLEHEVDGEIHVWDIFTEDLILLCSDGLNTMLKDNEIQDCIASGISTAKGLQEICDDLVLAANEAGGDDNTTVVLMEMVGEISLGGAPTDRSGSKILESCAECGVLTAVDGLYICKECEADVWVLTSIKNFDADLELDAVVLGNRKILSKNEGTKEMLESDFKAADNIWAEQNEGPMPSNELFRFLNVIHKNPQGIGQIMPVEDARELVKERGGLSRFD